MFKSAELPWLITFFQMFYNDKPVDWLLDYLIDTKVCNYDKDRVSLTTRKIFQTIIKIKLLIRRKIANRKRQNCGSTSNRHCFNTSEQRPR